MSNRKKFPAKSSPRLALEALEPRTLLTTVADWWSDVEQWANHAWWSDETWWEESAGDEGSQVADWFAADWATEELSGADPEIIAAAPETGVPAVDEPANALAVPLIAQDPVATSSGGETAISQEEPESLLPATSWEQADEPPSDAAAADVPLPVDEPRDRVEDASVVEATGDFLMAGVDVEQVPLEVDEIAAVAPEVELGAAGVDPEIDDREGIEETFVMPKTSGSPAIIRSQPAANEVAQPVLDAEDITGVEGVTLESEVPSDRFTVESSAPEEPIVSVPVGQAWAAFATSQTATQSAPAPVNGRRLAFWTGLLAPGGLFGVGGVALEQGGVGDSGVGTSGFMAAQPAGGRPRSRLAFRRVG